MTTGAGRVAVEAARAASGAAFATLLARGTMRVEFYAPAGVDRQTPHAQDELYVVTSGSGTFVCDGEPQPVEPGEVLFVPAGVDHRFVGFTDDFATWVVFYGPDGGEASR